MSAQKDICIYSLYLNVIQPNVIKYFNSDFANKEQVFLPGVNWGLVLLPSNYSLLYTMNNSGAFSELAGFKMAASEALECWLEIRLPGLT